MTVGCAPDAGEARSTDSDGAPGAAGVAVGLGLPLSEEVIAVGDLDVMLACVEQSALRQTHPSCLREG